MASDITAELEAVRRKCRILTLLAALERAGISPVEADRLHAFAYLADVLSPVWELYPYEDVVFKTKDGPYFVDLQEQLDKLVIIGLVDVTDLGYKELGAFGARITGSYELRLKSQHLDELLSKLGARTSSKPIEPSDRVLVEYLTDLAGALATLPNYAIDLAAMSDATYSSDRRGFSEVIDLHADPRTQDQYRPEADRTVANESVAITERFKHFLPEGSSFSEAERVYLYASYLGRKMAANG